jgi:hypothetical protein
MDVDRSIIPQAGLEALRAAACQVACLLHLALYQRMSFADA